MRAARPLVGLVLAAALSVTAACAAPSGAGDSPAATSAEQPAGAAPRVTAPSASAAPTASSGSSAASDPAGGRGAAPVPGLTAVPPPDAGTVTGDRGSTPARGGASRTGTTGSEDGGATGSRAGSGSSGGSGAAEPAGPLPAADYAQALADGVNAERVAAGLGRLAPDSCAQQAAEAWAEQLAARGVLEHQDVGAVMSRCSSSGAGENIARNSGGPAQVVAAWMDSPGHEANILRESFTHLGSAAVRAADGQVFAVHVFLTR